MANNFQDDRDIDLGKILDSLIDNTSANNLEFEFLIEAVAEKLTRRQSIILRLLLMDKDISQVGIAKLLGFSAPTINLELKKIQEVVGKILKAEGMSIDKLFKKNQTNKK